MPHQAPSTGTVAGRELVLTPPDRCATREALPLLDGSEAAHAVVHATAVEDDPRGDGRARGGLNCITMQGAGGTEMPNRSTSTHPPNNPMIATPEIVQTTAQPTAIIHVIVARKEIQNVMGPTIGKVFETIAAQGIAPAGPWFTHHLRRPTETFDFEVSVPVARAIAPAGGVQPGEWPAMKVVRTVYQGPYEGLGEAWGEFLDWIETSGLKTSDDLYECYLSGPESGPDPATWRTQLNRPLIG